MPLTPAQRVARANAKSVASGCRRITIMLNPDAVKALARLQKKARTTATGAICAALMAAAKSA